MFKTAIPVLHVSSSVAAEAFFCHQLGFTKLFAFHIDDAKSDPCYMGFERDNAIIHASSFPGDGVAGGVVHFHVEDVDKLHLEFVDKGVSIALEPTNQTWGSRELYIKDSDGNSLRFAQSLD